MNAGRMGLVALVVTAAAALVMGPAGPALAHEERVVGSYHFAVGFGDEPAYAGQKNSVQLILGGPNAKPVVDLPDTLKVEVVFGSQKLELPLEANFEVGEFGTPGDYRAWFFPTRAGSYTFHFFGTIKGRTVDESFTSSPSTFAEVTDPSQVQFPEKDPTVAEVAQRVDREFPRLGAAVAAQGRTARKGANSAKTVGYMALGAGILGLILAGVALARGRRSTSGGTPAGTTRAPTSAAG